MFEKDLLLFVFLSFFVLFQSRKQLAVVDLDEPLEKVKRVGRHSKYEVGVVQWNPHQSHSNLFVLAVSVSQTTTLIS